MWATTGPRPTMTSISWTRRVSGLAARRLPEGVAGVSRAARTRRGARLRARATSSSASRRTAGSGSRPWLRRATTSTRSTRALCARYRDRHHVGGAKSDAGDAKAPRRPGPHGPSQPPRGRRRQRRGCGCTHPRARPPAVHLGPVPADQPAAQRAPRVLPGVPWRPSPTLLTATRWACWQAPRPACGGAADHLRSSGPPSAEAAASATSTAAPPRSATRCGPRSSRCRPW